jgi:hypothetical protein
VGECNVLYASPDGPQLLIWPFSHLLHPPFTHHSQMSFKHSSGLFFHLPTTHNRPRQAINAHLGLYFTLLPPCHPCCSLTTSCKPRQASSALFSPANHPSQAQTSSKHSSGFHSTCQPPITSPDKLQALIWLFVSLRSLHSPTYSGRILARISGLLLVFTLPHLFQKDSGRNSKFWLDSGQILVRFCIFLAVIVSTSPVQLF